MTVIAALPVLVFVFGLVLYLFAVGVSKTSAAEIGRIMFFAGLLAFLLGSGAQMQSCGTTGGSAPAMRR